MCYQNSNTEAFQMSMCEIRYIIIPRLNWPWTNGLWRMSNSTVDRSLISHWALLYLYTLPLASFWPKLPPLLKALLRDNFTQWVLLNYLHQGHDKIVTFINKFAEVEGHLIRNQKYSKMFGYRDKSLIVTLLPFPNSVIMHSVFVKRDTI